MSWKLRVKACGETAQLHDVDPGATFHALQKRIAELVKIAIADQRILAGFPPKELPQIGDASAKGGEGERAGEGQGGEGAAPGSSEQGGHGVQEEQGARSLLPLTTTVQGMGIVNCDTLIVSQRSSGPPQQKQSFATGDAASPSRRGKKGEKRKRDGGGGGGSGGDEADEADEAGSKGWQEAAAEGVIKAASASASELEEELKPMRKALKEHLKQREQERLANQRLSAMLSGAFELEMMMGGRLADSMPSLRASFAVGPRKVHTEDVLMMGKPLLRAIVQSIVKDPDAKENLRLFNMAFFSPRVFWNLVYHYHDSEDPELDMEAKLIALAPDADWSFLAARKRNLSEKALENQFREEEEKRRRELSAAARAARAARKAQRQEEGREAGEGEEEGELKEGEPKEAAAGDAGDGLEGGEGAKAVARTGPEEPAVVQ